MPFPELGAISSLGCIGQFPFVSDNETSPPKDGWNLIQHWGGFSNVTPGIIALRNLVQGRRLDPKLKDMAEVLITSAKQADPDILFNALPPNNRQPHLRCFIFHGLPTENEFKFRPGKLPVPFTAIGRSEFNFCAEKITDLYAEKDGYGLHFSNQIDLGTLNPSQFRDFTDSLTQRIHEVGTSSAATPFFEGLAALQPALKKPSDQKLASLFYYTFPKLTAVGSHFLQFDKMGHPQGKYFKIDAKFYLQEERLKPKFPALHDYLDDLKGNFALKFVVQGPKGGKLFELEVSSQSGINQGLRVRLQGILNGQEWLEQPAWVNAESIPGVRLTQKEAFQLRVSLNGYASIWGLTTIFEKVVFDVGVNPYLDGDLSMKISLVNVPKVQVVADNLGLGLAIALGRISGVYDPDKDATQFFSAMALAFLKKGGTYATIGWAPPKKGNQDSQGTLVGQIPVIDSWVIHQVLAAASNKVLPNQEAANQLTQFTKEIFNAFFQDYQAACRKNHSTTCP